MNRVDADQRNYQRLHQDVPDVAFLARDCLPARSPLSKCHQCADACPVDALSASRGRLELSDDCLRCGQCAAACPTGALRVAGFPQTEALEPADTDTSRPLQIDCWRVPQPASPEGTLRVPCLGGLDAGTLAQLCTLQRGPVWLLDRGWCQECPAGGGAHPATSAVESAADALRASGAAPDRLPCIHSSPMDHRESASATIPPRMTEASVSRRGLFRHLAGQVASAHEQWSLAESAEGASAPEPLAGRIPAPPRRRMVRASLAFSERLPEALSPRVEVDHETCCNHRVCASLCPTGALSAVDRDGSSGLDFDPAACIDCGLCQGVCPERALSVAPSGGEAGRITRHAFSRCRECLRPFAGGGPGSLCPVCDKKYGLLAGGGYELLFGQPPQPRADGTAARVTQASRQQAGAQSKTKGSGGNP
ncbi:4Fe-4S dicluster domain-containing protein [Thioalkalivibrio sp. ARh3]|uniref:4Fe-4S dicluster domain-containing protein n=1 Tax=Thioalkalivibrio sp. ARh3 TaxID=1158148 RepID=UPI00035DC88A|nr:4Fe-4S binding protein [Thioalkalivibrio sp. ARh3]